MQGASAAISIFHMSVSLAAAGLMRLAVIANNIAIESSAHCLPIGIKSTGAHLNASNDMKSRVHGRDHNDVVCIMLRNAAICAVRGARAVRQMYCFCVFFFSW